MPSGLMRLCLFLNAYSPLWLLLALQIVVKSEETAHGISLVLAVILVLVAILSTSVLLIYLRLKRRSNAELIKVKLVTAKDGDAMAYIATYLIPFLNPNYQDWSVIVSLLVVFAVLAVLQIKANSGITNPMMLLLGYHMYELEPENADKTFELICRRRYIKPGELIYAVPSGNYSYVEVDHVTNR